MSHHLGGDRPGGGLSIQAGGSIQTLVSRPLADLTTPDIISITASGALPFPSFAFTTPIVDAQSGANITTTLSPTLNRFLILKATIVPSEPESNNRFEIYQDGAFAEELLAYGTGNFEGDLIEPMEERGLGPTERTFGLPAIYADRNLEGKFYLRIFNNHVEAQTYGVTVVLWPITSLVAGAGIGIAGDPENGDEFQTLSQTADTVRQLIKVSVDNVEVGTVPKLNVKSGNRATVLGALVSNAADITIVAANQVQSIEALVWAIPED